MNTFALSDQPPGGYVERRIARTVNGKKVKKWRWQRYPTSALEVRGNILLYKATIQGYRNEQIVLRYSLLRAPDDSLLGPPTIAYEFKSPRCSSGPVRIAGLDRRDTEHRRQTALRRASAL